jgi:hypothetical protein
MPLKDPDTPDSRACRDDAIERLTRLLEDAKAGRLCGLFLLGSRVTDVETYAVDTEHLAFFWTPELRVYMLEQAAYMALAFRLESIPPQGNA